jgi:hypothetical protein
VTGLEWLAALVAVGLVAAGMLLVRTRMLLGRRGAFECARLSRGARRWASGIGVFSPGRLEWYRLLSLSPRPAWSGPRSRLRVVERTIRVERGRPTSVVELTCACERDAITLAMREQVAAGFVSWVEAAPPEGRTWSESR